MRRGRPQEIYNVSSDAERTNLEVVRTILEALGKDESAIEFVEDRPGHDLRYSLDSSKLFRELGWRPEICFEEGIRETVRWYEENREWWKMLNDEKTLSPTPWKLVW